MPSRSDGNTFLIWAYEKMPERLPKTESPASTRERRRLAERAVHLAGEVDQGIHTLAVAKELLFAKKEEVC